MAYNPSSFNYTPMTREQGYALGQSWGYTPGASTSTTQFQPSQQFTEFAKWLSEQGMDMFNLARADRNTQLAVTNAFNQQQADRSNALQQAQLGMAQQAQTANISNQSAQLAMARQAQQAALAAQASEQERLRWDAYLKNIAAVENIGNNTVANALAYGKLMGTPPSGMPSIRQAIPSLSVIAGSALKK